MKCNLVWKIKRSKEEVPRRSAGPTHQPSPFLVLTITSSGNPRVPWNPAGKPLSAFNSLTLPMTQSCTGEARRPSYQCQKPVSGLPVVQAEPFWLGQAALPALNYYDIDTDTDDIDTER